MEKNQFSKQDAIQEGLLEHADALAEIGNQAITASEVSVPDTKIERPEFGNTVYQLMINRAAGDYYVVPWLQEEVDCSEESGFRCQDGHHTEYGLYCSEEELKQAITEARGNTVWAVFEDGPAGEVYYIKEDNLTGNWGGSAEAPASLVTSFDTEEEAKTFVRQRQAYFDQL